MPSTLPCCATHRTNASLLILRTAGFCLAQARYRRGKFLLSMRTGAIVVLIHQLPHLPRPSRHHRRVGARCVEVQLSSLFRAAKVAGCKRRIDPRGRCLADLIIDFRDELLALATRFRSRIGAYTALLGA